MFWPLVKLPSIEFWRFYAFWTLHFKSMFQQNSSPVNTHLQINSENLWIYILCVWGRTESRHLKNIFKDHFHCFGNVFSNITLKIGKDETTLMHNLSCTPKYDTHKPGFLAYLGWNSQLLMYSHGVINWWLWDGRSNIISISVTKIPLERVVLFPPQDWQGPIWSYWSVSSGQFPTIFLYTLL